MFWVERRLSQDVRELDRRMRNRMYGGVRGRYTKVERKLFRFLLLDLGTSCETCIYN